MLVSVCMTLRGFNTEASRALRRRSGQRAASSAIVDNGMEDPLRRIVEYAMTVYEANKRLLDPVVVEMITGPRPASLQDQTYRGIGPARA